MRICAQNRAGADLSVAANALSSPAVFAIAIRILGVLAVVLTAACSTVEPPAPKIPRVDLTNAQWQKLSKAQPDANPLRVAIVARDEKIGATRAVIKVPPSFALPPYWFAVRATYTVLKGTFVFEELDSDGKPKKLTQGPGSFAIVPPNLIQRAETAPGEEALLYVTVYGEWAPSFADGAFSQPVLRAGY